jgi:hypothetical protein
MAQLRVTGTVTKDHSLIGDHDDERVFASLRGQAEQRLRPEMFERDERRH